MRLVVLPYDNTKFTTRTKMELANKHDLFLLFNFSNVGMGVGEWRSSCQCKAQLKFEEEEIKFSVQLSIVTTTFQMWVFVD